jgi:hypothetical protein
MLLLRVIIFIGGTWNLCSALILFVVEMNLKNKCQFTFNLTENKFNFIIKTNLPMPL